MSKQMPVIRFQNVSKRFTFTKDNPSSFLELFTSAFSRRPRPKQGETNLWAVKDVTFGVLPGHTFGIVGRNGSGKSTILKLITRILRSTNGRIIVNGRVNALLELGAGFHPDLTGRENVYLNASLLGLSQGETDDRFDDILAFSELGEFIDMPVKHYSSGMYMRLGFSVAINMDPDILIVDEILAVGDQAFQTKCMDRIYKMKREGITIVIVSHNLDVMRRLCSHLLWLENGQMRMLGPAEEVAQQYQAYSNEFDVETLQEGSDKKDFSRMGSRELEITAVRFLDADGNKKRLFKTGDSLTIEMAYTAHKPILEPEFGLAIHRQDGLHINGPNSAFAGLEMGLVEGDGVVRYTIESLPLLPSLYIVTTAVHDKQTGDAYDYHSQAYSFRVVEGGTSEKYGLITIPATWEWQPLATAPKPADASKMPSR